MSTAEVRSEIQEKFFSSLPPALTAELQTEDSAFSMFDVDGDDE